MPTLSSHARIGRDCSAHASESSLFRRNRTPNEACHLATGKDTWLRKTAHHFKVFFFTVICLLASTMALSHGVADGDKTFIEQAAGTQLLPFAYLGAKHMVTGYDHLLFLLGVIFFLYRMRDVALYVTLFAVGHSVTLLFGVLASVHANPFLVDALIGLSVVYKALDNLNAFQHWFGFKPNVRAAVLGFGLAHGFGLATKLQEFSLSTDGLVANIISFNVGVELGQLLALGCMLIGIAYMRLAPAFERNAIVANTAIMAAGFMLVGFQLTGYFVNH